MKLNVILLISRLDASIAARISAPVVIMSHIILEKHVIRLMLDRADTVVTS